MTKKLISLAMVLMLALGVLAIPAIAATATPTASIVLVNGVAVAFDAYFIDGNNYFKLRDLAYTLSGTEKQFDVGWDSANNAISLTSGQPYTAVGGEMADNNANANVGGGVIEAKPTSSKIYLDDREVQFTAFNIGGNNYFKLRDIGEAFNFGVDWDGAKNTIVIDTSNLLLGREADQIWQSLYRGKIIDLAGDYAAFDERALYASLVFYLIDIDDDGIPELVEYSLYDLSSLINIYSVNDSSLEHLVLENTTGGGGSYLNMEIAGVSYDISTGSPCVICSFSRTNHGTDYDGAETSLGELTKEGSIVRFKERFAHKYNENEFYDLRGGLQNEERISESEYNNRIKEYRQQFREKQDANGRYYLIMAPEWLASASYYEVRDIACFEPISLFTPDWRRNSTHPPLIETEKIDMFLRDFKAFRIENGILTQYRGGGGRVVIPDGVVAIGRDAFAGSSNIKFDRIEIPHSVTRIEAHAFLSCHMDSFYIPNSVVFIGDKAIGYELVGQSYEPIEGLLIYGEGNDNAAEKYAIDNGFRYWNVNNSE